MDSNAVFAILLLIVGLAILTAEVFVPSGGMLGLITFFVLIFSLIFAYRAWWPSHPNIFGAFCVMLFLLVPTVIGLGFYMLPRTAFGKKVLLEARESKDLMPFPREASRQDKLVGRYGVALTPLNPGGLVRLDGERMHALSEGLSIEPGESVEIVDVRGSSIVVRPGTPPEPESSPSGDSSPEVTSPLDFDFPPST